MTRSNIKHLLLRVSLPERFFCHFWKRQTLDWTGLIVAECFVLPWHTDCTNSYLDRNFEDEKPAIYFEDVVILFLSRKAEQNLFRLNLIFGFSTSERPFPSLGFYTNTRKGVLRALNKYFCCPLSGGHWVYPWNNRPWNDSKIPLSFDALLILHFSYSLQSTEVDKMECPVSFSRCFMFLYVVKHKTTELLVFVTSKY